MFIWVWKNISVIQFHSYIREVALDTLIFIMCATQVLPTHSLSLIHEHKCMSIPLMRMAALNYRLLITVVYDQNVVIEWMSERVIVERIKVKYNVLLFGYHCIPLTSKRTFFSLSITNNYYEHMFTMQLLSNHPPHPRHLTHC